MWWIILVTFILFIFIYLLFAPFFVEIDSDTGLFRLRFHVLASAWLIINTESIFLNLKIGWWKKEIDLLLRKEKKKYEPDMPFENWLQAEKKSIPFHKTWKKIKAVVKSFRVTKCYIMIDTGNMPWNGILYPWFYLFSRRVNKNVMINFRGENTVILQIQNSLARMLWAYIKS